MYVIDGQGHRFFQFMVYYNSSFTSVHVSPLDPHSFAMIDPKHEASPRMQSYASNVHQLIIIKLVTIPTVPATNAQHGRRIFHIVNIFRHPIYGQIDAPLETTKDASGSRLFIDILNFLIAREVHQVLLVIVRYGADPIVRFGPEHQPVQIVPVIFVQFDGSYFGAGGENQVAFGNDQFAPGAVLSESFVAERTKTLPRVADHRTIMVANFVAVGAGSRIAARLPIRHELVADAARTPGAFRFGLAKFLAAAVLNQTLLAEGSFVGTVAAVWSPIANSRFGDAVARTTKERKFVARLRSCRRHS